MTQLEQQLNSTAEKMAEEYYQRTGYVPTEWAVMNFKAGASSMIPLIVKLQTALQHSANGCLVPPDGGSPDVYDHINNAKQALLELQKLIDKHQEKN